ncbi:MAG: VOC family protein [Deltaproteobacteria bacterium]|nr:VOC family protein [Deltaproteobacteria bacterium]
MGTKDEKQPVIEVKGKEIIQVGIVVQDAAKTAKRFSELFGIGPWMFFDTAPAKMILHDKSLKDGESAMRLAIANLARMQIELIQPLYGLSTYQEFLKEQGEGVHHLSFGSIDNHDEFVTALKRQDIGIEMQGLLGGALTFTYMSTQKDLGTIFEVLKPAPPGTHNTLEPWGTYAPQGPGSINIKGKEIVQVGIVVEDAEKMARRYWEIFGIGPWVLIDFKKPHVTDAVFHGITMTDTDFHVKAALANHGNLQFELLQPVEGPSTHMEFLKTHGEGVHHLSFGEVDDHDEVVSAFENQGISIESTGLLGGAAIFTYMATQKDLGTIFELVKVHPGVQTTLVPYGIYPPSN